MIRIKVCKLSDIVNRSILGIISFLLICFVCHVSLKIMESCTYSILEESIQMNLGVKKKKNFLEEMIFVTLPISSFSMQDDIEKEFNFVDNKEYEDLKNEEEKKKESFSIEERQEISIINEKIDLQPASLLKCEKKSDSKYQIGSVTVNDYTQKNLDL